MNIRSLTPIITFALAIGCTAPAYAGYTSTQIASGLNHPQGIAVDGAGNLFVSEYQADEVVEITAASGYTAVQQLGGTEFFPQQLALDSGGNLYVAESGSNAVQSFLAPGYTTISHIGTGFTVPQGVAVDTGGNVFVADTYNGAVKEIPVGNQGTALTLATGFSLPTSIAVDGSENLFVADFTANQVYELLASESYAAKHPIGSGFNGPAYLLLDPAGNLYVSDFRNNAVKEVPAAGGYVAVETLFTVQQPTGLALGGSGVYGHPTLLVADIANSTVSKYVYSTPVPSLGPSGLLLFGLGIALSAYRLLRRRTIA